MSPLNDLLLIAGVYAQATGLAEGTVSDRVLKGGNRLRDLREGRGDIGVKRLATAVRWFSDHWPEGATWPADVPRPTRADAPAAEGAA